GSKSVAPRPSDGSITTHGPAPRARTSIVAMPARWTMKRSIACCWAMCGAPSLSHHFRAGCLELLAQLALEFGEKLLRVGRRHVAVVEIVRLDVLLPASRLRQPLHHALIVGDGLGRHVRWSDHAAGLGYPGQIVAKLLHRRHVLEGGQP